jgi:hypothetical protein
MIFLIIAGIIGGAYFLINRDKNSMFKIYSAGCFVASFVFLMIALFSKGGC